MTKEQKQAIKTLEKALLKCKNAEIRLFGMDGDLYYCTLDAAAKYPDDHTRFYSPSADACHAQELGTGRIDSYGAYLDSGGW